MAFKISSSSSSNESFSAIAKEHSAQDFLVISIGDRICLDSLSGWQPLQSKDMEYNNSGPTLQPAEKSPVTNAQVVNSQDPPEQYTINNSDCVNTLKRKIISCNNDVGPKSKSHLDDEHVSSHKKSKLSNNRIFTSERPHSLPDLRKCNEVSDIDEVPCEGITDGNKERSRLKSISSSLICNLQKNSPVSKSLSNISDTRSETVSTRNMPAAEASTKVQSNPGQVFTPDPDTIDSSNVSKPNSLSLRKSCVRRLNLDDDVLSGSLRKVTRNGHLGGKAASPCNGFVHVQHVQRKLSSGTAKRQLLSSFAKADSNADKNLGIGGTEKQSIPISKAVGNNQSRKPLNSRIDLPQTSNTHTEKVWVNNTTDKFLSTLDRSKSSFRPIRTDTERTNGTYRDTCVDISTDGDGTHTSEELFDGSQNSRDGHNTATQNSTSSQKTPRSINIQELELVYNVLNRSVPARSENVAFTTSQVKSMCDVLSRLYSS